MGQRPGDSSSGLCPFLNDLCVNGMWYKRFLNNVKLSPGIGHFVRVENSPGDKKLME